MLNTIFTWIKTSLQKSISVQKHPFRYCTLATMDASAPKLRTVVLREVTNSLSILFYTDARTQKVKQIQRNPKASLLFYDPIKMIQVTMEGNLKVSPKGDMHVEKWTAISERAKKDYTTTNAPGTPIGHPEMVTHTQNNNHFVILTFIPHTISYLHITKPQHTRAIFHHRKKQWEGVFLTP